MLLREVVETSEAVAATASRSAKIALLADCLARLASEEAAVGVAFLSGQLRQRQIGVGYASIRETPTPAGEPTLGLAEVDAIFEAVGQQAGSASQAGRRRILQELFTRATEREQR